MTPSVNTVVPTARERARRAMLDQIAAIAVDLFDRHGFEHTTIDEVCAAAGISRTTFFRYFQTKEDLLAREFADLGDDLLRLLQQRPAGEAAWVALREALLGLAQRYAAAPDASVRAVRLVLDNPTLATFHRDKLTAWSAQLEPSLRERLRPLSSDVPDPRPEALTTAAFGCLDAALTAWVAGGASADLTAITRAALDAFD